MLRNAAHGTTFKALQSAPSMERRDQPRECMFAYPQIDNDWDKVAGKSPFFVSTWHTYRREVVLPQRPFSGLGPEKKR